MKMKKPRLLSHPVWSCGRRPVVVVLLIICWSLTLLVQLSHTFDVASGNVYTMASFATDCLSENTPQSSFPTSSNLFCAVQANRMGAFAFSFGDEVCNITGEGIYEHRINVSYTFIPSMNLLEEVAYRKTTYAVPHLYGFTKEKAVDGSEDGNNLYHSSFNIEYPWWQVDLGEIRTIHLIRIKSRPNNIERFHDIEVRLGKYLHTTGNFSSYALFATYLGPLTLQEGSLFCASHSFEISGRYISIQRVTPEVGDMLQLSEVKVYALKTP